MEQRPGISKIVWFFLTGIGLLILVICLNFWLISQMKEESGKPPLSMDPTSVGDEATEPRGIPVIDPQNDPLAPVGTKAATPETFLKRKPQESNDQKEADFPMPGKILLQ